MENDRLLFVDGWLFLRDAREDGSRPEACEEAYEPVTLPHDWQIFQARDPEAEGGAAQGFYPREHLGWYRRHFTPPEAWRGRQVRLLFDGVQRFSSVYLNGQLLGGRPYGYVPFVVELTQALRWGADNLLAVKVDNREGGGDRWYSGAGIYRNVYLLVDEPSHLVHDGVRLTAWPDGRGGARVTVEAEVEQPGEARLSVRVLDPAGAVCAQAGQPAQALTRVELALADASLWSPDSPSLYRAQLTLERAGRALDRQEVCFGVRAIELSGTHGLLLNGRSFKLHGVNLHHDGGAVGAAVPEAVWRRRLGALKALGVNAIRCSHNPQAEEFYDLCDEMGFLVIDEIYDKWSDSGMYFDRVFDEWRFRDLDAMMRRDRNHPCVFLWSVGNEVTIQYSEKFFYHLEELCRYVRSQDPTRPVSLALNGFVLQDFPDSLPIERKTELALRYASIVDVFMGNYMEQYYDHFRAAGMRLPVIGSEVLTYYRHTALNSVQLAPVSAQGIVEQRDYVCGGFVWAGIDYLGESLGWPCRGWTGCLMDSTGWPKLRAHHLAAQWLQEPVLKLAVLDESEPWDMAPGMWGFPQMSRRWNFEHRGKVLHVVAMTNCEEVRLTLNGQLPRVEALDGAPDHMVHFYLPFEPGTLLAEGYRAGRKVCEDRLVTATRSAGVRLIQEVRRLPADGRAVAHLDVVMEDKFGQLFTQAQPLARFEVEGPLELMAVDNGDHASPELYASDRRSLFKGHVMALVRAGRVPGEACVKVAVEGFAPLVARFSLVEPERAAAQGGL